MPHGNQAATIISKHYAYGPILFKLSCSLPKLTDIDTISNSKLCPEQTHIARCGEASDKKPRSCGEGSDGWADCFDIKLSRQTSFAGQIGR